MPSSSLSSKENLFRGNLPNLCSWQWGSYFASLDKYVKLDMQCQLHSKRKEYSVDTAVAGYAFLPTEAIASLLKIMELWKTMSQQT